MSVAKLIAELPDETRFWNPVTGEVTLAEIRATPEDEPALSLEAATIEMWCDIGTRNLRRHPWEQHVTPSEIRASHVSRYTSALRRRRST